MVGDYLMLFQTYTRGKFTIAQNQLCSFTNLISQKFSDSAVILKEVCKTFQLWGRKARVLDFCFPTIQPFQKIFSKATFSLHVLTLG